VRWNIVECLYFGLVSKNDVKSLRLTVCLPYTLRLISDSGSEFNGIFAVADVTVVVAPGWTVNLNE